MIVYLIPLLLSVLGICLFDINKRKGELLYGIIWLYLVLLIGLRFEVGGDTLVYMEDYKWRPDLTHWKFSWIDYYEPLYTLLCAVCKTVSDDFVLFQLVHSVILNTCLFYFISKSTPYKFSALFLCFIYYYLYFSTEILRESLAIFVFILNYKNYEEGNWLKYYVGAVIAIMFHISAIILLIFPFVKWMRFNKIYVLTLIICIIVFSKLDILFSIFSGMAKISGKIRVYEDASATSLLSIVLTFLAFSRFTLIPLLIYLWDKKVLKEHPQFEGLICFYTILGVGIWFNPVIFDRFPNYITPLYFASLANIIVPSFFKSASASRKLIGTIFLCLIIAIYGSYPLRIYKRYVPYYSVINPQSVYRGDLHNALK